jgi:hypothetical protein
MLSQNPTTNYTSQILLEFEVHDVDKTKDQTYKRHQNERNDNLGHGMCWQKLLKS